MQMIKFNDLTDAQNEKLIKMTNCQVGYMKWWTGDTGRSITGAFKGTLIGIFPKLTFTIGHQTESQRQQLLQLINSDFKTVSYWDSERGSYITKTFYFGDVADTIKKAVGSSSAIIHDSVQVDAVATTKR